MTETLLSCPFCGSPAELEHGSDHHGSWFNLGCSRHWGRDPDNKCHAGRIWYTETEIPEAEAIAAWNRRPTAPASGLGEEWVLVPRNPTPKMKGYGGARLQAVTHGSYDLAHDVYVTMIEAAPAALSPPPRDGGRGASVAESAAGSASRDAAGDAQRKSEGAK